MCLRLRAVLAAVMVVVVVVVVPPATAKPEQIRAVQEPVFHFYLQAYPEDPTIPIMGPEASSEYFEIGGGGTIQSANSSAYLNIASSLDDDDDAASSSSSSYKTLVLASAGADDATDAWALEGDTIITGTDSAYGRQLNFLVCQLGGGSGGGFWQVYLQTGSDVPEGRTCSNFQSLHLPCLC